jgi:hypothetical protein
MWATPLSRSRVAAHNPTDARWLTPDRAEIGWARVCPSRRNFPAHADVWSLRFRQARQLPGLRAAVRSGTCRFSPAQVVIKANGQEVALRSAAEAFVPNRLTLALQDRLPVQRACNHVKGHGGHKAADRQARDWVAGGGGGDACVGTWDIRGYCAHFDDMQLLHLLSRHVRGKASRKPLSAGSGTGLMGWDMNLMSKVWAAWLHRP